MPALKTKLSIEEVVALRQALARQSIEARKRPETKRLLETLADQIRVEQGPGPGVRQPTRYMGRIAR